MKQQLIRRQFGHEPMHHSEPPSIRASEVTDGGGEAAIRFGRFLLLPRARQFLVDEQPVDLGSRAFDLLMLLIKAQGKLVTKSEILARVWPDTVVAESNLQVQVSALRKVLSQDRDIIRTIPRRGYMFAVEDTASSVESGALIPRGQEPSPPLVEAAGSANLYASRLRPRGARWTVPDDEARPTVVVIDDDQEIRKALQGLLRSVGLRVELFGSVQEFLDSARPDLPGCQVRDVRLPGRSRLDFHDDLVKGKVHLPVISISGQADVPTSVRAMKAGAVEFPTEPVRRQDLLDAIGLATDHDHARRDEQQVVARLRADIDTPLHLTGTRQTTLRVGPLEVDLLDRTAKRNDRSIRLLPREFRLLEYMMRHRDQVLSRPMLFKEVWNYTFVPETNIVDVHMGRLRRKVDMPKEAPMIQNVRGAGFILSAPT